MEAVCGGMSLLPTTDTRDSYECSFVASSNIPKPYQQTLTRENITNDRLLESTPEEKYSTNEKYQELKSSPIGINEMVTSDAMTTTKAKKDKKRGKWPSPFLSDASKANAIEAIENAFRNNKKGTSSDSSKEKEDIASSFQSPAQSRTIDPYEPLYSPSTYPNMSSLAHPAILSSKVLIYSNLIVHQITYTL
jgi:hypothetical protein